MLTILPGDEHYLGITGLVTVLMQATCFLIAYTFQIDKITDLAGSTNFILIALLSLLAGAADPATGAYNFAPRAVSMTTLLCITRAELAAYLLYRVMKRGHDARFDEMRSKFLSFMVFWVFQALWAWNVTLPVIFVNGDAAAGIPLEGRDVAGIVLAVAGFLIETVSDLQKDAFRSNKANSGRACDTGLWSWSRHPNFFGEILLQWGIWLHGTPVYDASGAKWGYFTLIGPLITMFFLLAVSGIPTAEGVHQKRYMRSESDRSVFLEYRRSTSPLVLLPPALYRALPLAVKRWALFEWSMYEMDWAYVGADDQATKLQNEGYGAVAGRSAS